MTKGYRRRLFAVLAGLIFLQSVYFLLIAAVACGTLLLTIAMMSIDIPLNFLTLIVYAGVPIAGMIAILFLLKPLFVRRPRAPEPMRLPADSEPVLFDFLRSLCATLGSPVPARVYVDLHANASAAIHGWRGFVTGEFDLNIGLPLARGLSLSQFTGVLAHEFGHFSQSVALRALFLIRKIQAWFSRVVYQRDSWDAWLDRRCRRRDWRFQGIALFAAFIVAVGRECLQLLMKVGQSLNSGLSRQMEFDADRYQAAVVGAEIFEQTLRDLRLLHAATQSARRAVVMGSMIQHLPDDVPALAVQHASRFSMETSTQILLQMTLQKTGHWDSHPCLEERLASIRETNPSGILAYEGPAEQLFTDLPALCRKATELHYQRTRGNKFDRSHLTPAKKEILTVAPDPRSDAATRKLFHATPEFCSQWFRKLKPLEPGCVEHEQASEDRDVKFDEVAYKEALRINLLHFAGLTMRRNGALFPPKSFALVSNDYSAIVAEEARSAQELRDLGSGFCGYTRTIANRMEALSSVEDSEVWRCYIAIFQLQEQYLQIRRYRFASDCVRRNGGLLRVPVCAALLDELQSSIRSVIYRISEAPEPVPASLMLRPDVPATLGKQLAGLKDLDRVPLPAFLFHYRVLAAKALDRLCSAVVSAE